MQREKVRVNTVYLSLGSNMGDSVGTLQWAIESINNSQTIEVTRISRLYITEPIGFVDQDYFYNCCIAIETQLSPLELLDCLQEIENKSGRVRTIRWGPRTLDIDILLYNEHTINSERLIVPHERMFERAFVLLPLLDILNSEVYHPIITESLSKIGDSQGIRVCENEQWEEK